MDSVWTMEALLARPARSVSDQRHFIALSSTLSRDTTGDAVTAEIIRRYIRYQKSPQNVQLSLFDERP
jgi:hypothetical protein